MQTNTNYANVAYDALTYNMASDTLTIESNSNGVIVTSCIDCRRMHCNIISSCQSAVISEILKRYCTVARKCQSSPIRVTPSSNLSHWKEWWCRHYPRHNFLTRIGRRLALTGHRTTVLESDSCNRYYVTVKDRPNFGFGFNFGTKSVDCNTFDILSFPAESSHNTFGVISVSTESHIFLSASIPVLVETRNSGFRSIFRYCTMRCACSCNRWKRAMTLSYLCRPLRAHLQIPTMKYLSTGRTPIITVPGASTPSGKSLCIIYLKPESPTVWSCDRLAATLAVVSLQASRYPSGSVEVVQHTCGRLTRDSGGSTGSVWLPHGERGPIMPDYYWN